MRGDHAVSSRGDDRLDRAPFANRIVAALRAVGADYGLVVAVMGRWGSGKTSVLNMMREGLEDVPERTVLEFNPWMFSGSEQLVSAFFDQVSAQLSLSKGAAERALATQLAEYGQALAPLVFIPVAGPWLARAGAASGFVGKVLNAGKKSDPINERRRRIVHALEKLPEPIYVFLDDLDRLTGREIRDVFALVRLTAHFPKIIYVMAFDRSVVEQALDEPEGTGRSYLDKIVEVSFDLPEIAPSALDSLLIDGIQDAVDGLKTGPFDQDRWPSVFYQVIRPLFSTPREVRRYLAPLSAMIGGLGEEVALVDALALEALRIRLPDLFARLAPLSEALTAVGMQNSQSPDWKTAVQNFTAAAGEHEEATRALCRLLFPPTERYFGANTAYGSDWVPRWRAERRVASLEVLKIYLSGLVPAGTVPASLVDQAVAVLADHLALQTIVDTLPDSDLDDLLARLEGEQARFTPAAAEPASAVLLEIYPRLRKHSTGFLDPGPEISVDRVVLRLLQAVTDDSERSAVVERLCTRVESLTGRIRLTELAGRRPNPQFERLIPAEVSDRLYQQACREIRHATATRVAGERDPLNLLATALAENPGDRADVDAALREPEVAAALLRSAVTDVRSQTLGGASAVHIEHVLRWEALRIVIGENDAISQLIQTATRIVQSDDAGLATAISLARQYLEQGPPASFPFSTRPLVLRPARYYPSTYFSPSLSTGWPAVLIRAVTTYEVDPLWAQAADIAGRDFHDRLARTLGSARSPDHLAAMAEARSLPARPGQWEPDPDASQFSSGAVERLTIGQDSPSSLIRVGVFLDERTGPTRLVTDLFVSPTPGTDSQWAPIQLKEIRDLMSAALEIVSGPIAEVILRDVFAGELPSRNDVELFLSSDRDHTSDGRTDTTLARMIDLSSLGSPTRPQDVPRDGMFAVSGDTATSSPQDRRHLAGSALARMALDWGYLDSPAALEPLSRDD